jgi:putative ABC transport system permease protein
MRFLPLLLANLGRKKLRTALTIGSFAVALFLFALLAAIRNGFRQGIDVAGADRLVVINRVSLIRPLPMAYGERLARVPHVTQVSSASWFGGVYRDERNFFPQFAVEPETFPPMFPEFLLPEDQRREFLADRRGCVVGRKTALRFGWKLGDRIPLHGTIYPGVWEFNLRGIYAGKRQNDDETQFWLRADYLQEKGPAWGRGYVGWYWVRVDSPEHAAAVAREVDAAFANSPWETRTQTERAFAASWVRQMGNVELLLLAVGGVVFFTLLLVTGNTMAMVVRERSNEHAVLRAIGYSDGLVLALALAEAAGMALVGGVVGLGLALWLITARDLAQGIFLLYLPPSALAGGVALALAAGVLAMLPPALGEMRLRVAQALRRV